MKSSGFYIFLSVILLVYSLVNCYILKRSLHYLPDIYAIRFCFIVVLLFFVACYPLARFIHWQPLSHILLWLGSYYLAVMIFAFFSLLIIDLFGLVNKIFQIVPISLSAMQDSTRIISFSSAVLFILFLTVIGTWNAHRPRLRSMDITINKTMQDNIVIMVMSDVHLGKMTRPGFLNTILDMVKRQQPDILLIAGDMFDEDVNSFNPGWFLSKLKSRYGVYAIPGNHEYFSGIENAISQFRSAGIRVLRDESVIVGDRLVLVGRDDRMKENWGGQRMPIQDLVHNVDTSLPIILMDHQPFHLFEAEKNGVDLQVSGHTHHGQIFPFNLITKALYEKSWGYLIKGNTHYYVSCGVGTWGPPVRLGSSSELVCITLHGKTP
jgi:uncharacterized protein